MENHPINSLMEKAMENIKKMVEVNTIIGDAVETKNGTVIIPVTKVSCGFAAGGSQYAPKEPVAAVKPEDGYPFGGGSGGGVSVQPIGFLVLNNDDVRFQVVDDSMLLDRLIDQVPEFILQLKGAFSSGKSGKQGRSCHGKKGPAEDNETVIQETTIITTTESKEPAPQQ